jgi:hypothetical protein
VDVKALKTEDVDKILFGQGYEDLNLNSLAMSRPRHGMEAAQCVDISLGGLRVSGAELKPGTAAVIDIHLPDERVVVKALVEVVWVRTEEAQPQAGMRFAAMHEQGASLVKGYLEQLF